MLLIAEFLAAAAVFAAIVIVFVYLPQERRLALRIDRMLDERLSERMQLARDLNDSFLQTVEASKLLADNALSKSNDVAEMRQALEKLSNWLEKATAEGRSALDSLRASINPQNELAEALHRATNEHAEFESIQVSFNVVGESREMHPIVRDEIYRIGYEAIRNAFSHAHAKRLTVDLIYGRDVSLIISDNGCGFDEGALAKRKSEAFGLERMREQAARIGAKLLISSSASGGTKVHLRVPGKVTDHKGAGRKEAGTSQ